MGKVRIRIWWSRLTQGWTVVVVAAIAFLIAYWFVYLHWYVRPPDDHLPIRVREVGSVSDAVLAYFFFPAKQVHHYRFRYRWRKHFRKWAGGYRIAENGAILTVAFRPPNRLEFTSDKEIRIDQRTLPKVIKLGFGEYGYIMKDENGDHVNLTFSSDFRSLTALVYKQTLDENGNVKPFAAPDYYFNLSRLPSR